MCKTPRIQFWVILAALVLLLPLSGAAQSPEPELRFSAEVPRGELLSVEVSAAGLSAVDLELSYADGQRRWAEAWRSPTPREGDSETWIALLGVPSTAETGPADLSLTFSMEDGSSFGLVRRFEVVDREFRAERIALSTAMTDLRSSDDPRKAEQSRILWELLHVFDPEALYHGGAFSVPVAEARRTSYFGDRRLFAYSDGGEANAIHNGLDLAAPTGTPVWAPARGRVVMAQDRILTGYTIVLEHLPGVFSMYYHLDQISVEEGTVVNVGDSIGTVGSTGLSTGPHLHWEIRASGVAVDPQKLLERPLVDIPGFARALSSSP